MRVCLCVRVCVCVYVGVCSFGSCLSRNADTEIEKPSRGKKQEIKLR